jgi:LAO/AO transport system kinase
LKPGSKPRSSPKEASALKAPAGRAVHLPGLQADLLAGDRRALARAITLIESTRTDDAMLAETLLMALLPSAGRSLRIGITGAPGVGKSTFIEAFGRHLTARGHRVAVLAIDPTSARSGGAILGDKTRMEELARDPNAFIRPSPSGKTAGGVARRTREAVNLVEAAGFDVVVVETVGVGQSETAVAEMVDVFVLLLSPVGGDDLQGIKRGVMELADILVVTKSDGALVQAAKIAQAEFRAAVHLQRPRFAGWHPKVVRVSALKGKGVAEVWAALGEFRAALEPAGALADQRRAQDRDWLMRELTAGLLDRALADARVARRLPKFSALVAAGKLLPRAAARRLIEAAFGER